MTDTAGDRRTAPRENGKSANGESASDAAPRTWRRGGNEMTFRGSDSNLVDTLSQTDAPEDAEALFDAELNRDHILANLTDEDLWYRRHELDINLDLALASAPPSESIWRGARREAAGLDGKPQPFTPTEVQQLRDTRDAAYARNTRSREGWQQQLLAEQQSERRVVEERSDDSGGILSKLVG